MSTRHIAQSGVGASSGAVEAPSYAAFLPAPAPALLYRQFFTPEECDRLDRTPPDSALSEISVLRVLISRLLAAARRVEMTIKRHFSMLSAFCQATSTMASLASFELQQQGPPLSPLDLLYPPGTEDEPL
jgi:hypothetical protein